MTEINKQQRSVSFKIGFANNISLEIKGISKSIENEQDDDNDKNVILFESINELCESPVSKSGILNKHITAWTLDVNYDDSNSGDGGGSGKSNEQFNNVLIYFNNKNNENNIN